MKGRGPVTVRIGRTVQLALTVLDRAATSMGLRSPAYTEILLRQLLRKMRVGEVDASALKVASSSEDKLDETYRCSVSPLLREELELTAATTGSTVAELIRAAIIFEPEFRERLRLEQQYRESGAGGNPAFMSDVFLQLWARHRTGTIQGVETVVYRATRSLELEVAKLREQVDSLLEERTTARRGRLVSPTKKEIQGLSLGELRQLAREHGFQLVKKTNVALARRRVLAYFGHSTTE